jgi:hypothetical protein
MLTYRAMLCSAVLTWCIAGPLAYCQANNQAGIRGTVSDPSKAVIPGAKVTVVNVGTNISKTSVTDDHGGYAFTALVPANYKMLVDAPGFGRVEKVGITLDVNQQTTLNIFMKPSSQETTVTVQAVPVLLDSDNATLGADIGSQYLTQIPLQNRDPFGIAFLAAGVTETAGSGINDSYPAGTNFVSNGQRNATADIRLDGNLITAPEQGEGGTTNIYYQATVEGLQEVKVQNNSVSAEYGSSGGTVIDEVMKSGTNALHGSAYLFNQNAIYDARDYFNTGPKPDHSQYQTGFSLGGPIVKNKTFFFADLESVIASNPVNIVATVPTAAQIAGDFSQSMTYDQNGNAVLNQIFDPFLIDPVAYSRPAYPNNMIPAQEISPVGQAVLKLYPQPNTAGDPVSGANNYRKVILASTNQLQFDVKVDQHFTEKSTLSGRYSNVFGSGSTPTVFGDAEFNDGLAYTTRVFNDGVNYSYTPTSNTLWTSTIGLDRVSQPSHTNYPSPTSVGFPAYLEQNSVVRMPSIIMEDAPWTSIYDQSSVDTHFAHTLLDYSSSFSWTRGKQTLKFGGEQRIFYNNFFQPAYPNGYFSFAQHITAQVPFDTNNGIEGNDFAGLLIGYGDPSSSGINVSQSVADKSKETAFYAQDDWRITPKLTLNLGLRYQWSTPYTERHNNSQFSDFNGDSAVSIAGFPGTLKGTTIFASHGMRNLPTDRNDIAPRLGFAYLVNDKLVVRGGAGIYYGMSVATNYQYPGTAFTSSPVAFFTLDGYLTQNATLGNPFPGGIQPPQDESYGKLAMWGLPNPNNLGTQTARNADIYQWNLGIQQAFRSNIVVGINYSANRSAHLPWGGYNSTSNRNFIASSIREQQTSESLSGLVNNPFQGLFSGPGAVINQPESRYGDSQLPLLNLLRPYPQFDGPFEGLPLLSASSWYNALQVVFQKRQGKYLNFEGNYTWSKNTDNSSTGFNAFVGTLNNGNPQELDNLKAEWSVSANDATNRFVAAVVFKIPVGRGDLVGSHMNRALDGVVGGWQLTTLTTFQTGQPLPVAMGNARIADGNQRPDVTCAKSTSLTTGISIHDAGRYGTPYLNTDCFADPGDQQPGNAPRYFSAIRADGIRQTDLTLEKQYLLGERLGHLEVHADCFNCTNTERFGLPDTGYGNSTFGIISGTAGGALPRNMQLGIRYDF